MNNYIDSGIIKCNYGGIRALWHVIRCY